MKEIIKVNNIDLIYRSAQTISLKKIAKMIITKSKDNILSNYKALNNVSFTIERGKVYALIGNNGAGKSTMLKVLSGVMSPNKGSIDRNYKTINLLALGVGFSKELSGIENIFLNGMLLGFTKKEINKVKDKIIDFSELGEFIYKPMKTYSSGMVSRLGFSIAINLKPEVLLIDEVLSVGDNKFKKKSYEAIKEIIEDENTTVVIVTHSMDMVKQLCDYVIWLDKGEVVAKGKTMEILNLYNQYNSGKIDINSLKRKSKGDIYVKNNRIKINADNYYISIPDSEKRKCFDKIYDEVKNYYVGNGELCITKRVLDNGDIFLYLEGNSKEDINVEILLDNMIEEKKFDFLYKKPPYNNRYGENKITGIHSYINLDTGSALVTKVYYFREKINEYSQGEQSYLLELDHEANNIVCENNTIKINLEGGNFKKTFTIILSQSKLFKNDNNLTEYMEYYYDGVFNNCVWCSFFLRPSGTYTKLPYSIEPFTRDGYGFSLQHSSRKDLVPFFEKTKENFFFDMINNAILQVYMYQKNENYVFFTPYTSTWLKKDTGITAPYIDTRLNETFIYMLSDFLPYTKLNDKINPFKNYVDLLYNYYLEGKQIYKLNSGIFFPDYFKDNLKKMTHSSLNHQLGTASLFYQAYEKYNDDKYKEVFYSILKFIEETKDNWVNTETGDIYYGIRYNEKKEIEFYGNDYIYVTLLDLLLIQQDFVKLNKTYNEVLKDLTRIKVKYLQTTQYDLFNTEAKNPPGERIESRIQALKLYKQLYSNDDLLK